MAGIDKIYMTSEQGKEFWLWILDNDVECQNLTTESLVFGFWKTDDGYVTNYSESIDWYLWNNCELDFIQKRLHEQYSDPPKNEFFELANDLINICGNEGALNLLSEISKYDIIDLELLILNQ